MPAIRQDEIDEIIRRKLSQTNRNPYNNDSFDGGMDPHTIYLYCWDRVNEHGPEQPCRGFKLFYERPIYNKVVLAERVNEAAQKIFNGEIEPDGDSFESFEWQRKSFVVILLTDPETPWRFPKGKSIVFDEGLGEGNHTFFNAFHPKVSVTTFAGEKPIQALCFKNWMVDSYGRPLGDGLRENFHYWLFPVGGGRAVMAAIDPGGTNLGPPMPPP